MVDPDATPTPSIGRIVHHRGISSNGTNVHSAIITRVWSKTCVNVLVFPDGGDPSPQFSQELVDPDMDVLGWFWPTRV
jgi:hypothetical protein